MSGPVTVSVPVTTRTQRFEFRCLTGFVRRRGQVDIFQRGTHLLVDTRGRVIATLRSDRVNLFALEGRFVTVCGIDEGEIEGVTSLRVTQVLTAQRPGTTPPPAQTIDLRLLLLLLLLRPDLLRGIRQDVLLALLFNTGLLGSLGGGFGGLGLGGLGLGGLGTTGLAGLAGVPAVQINLQNLLQQAQQQQQF